MKTVTQKVFGFLYKTCLANPGIGNSVTITQIPEYQNGFVFNGKTAYLENLNILAITDFTAIAKRVWANKDNPMNALFTKVLLVPQ